MNGNSATQVILYIYFFKAVTKCLQPLQLIPELFCKITMLFLNFLNNEGIFALLAHLMKTSAFLVELLDSIFKFGAKILPYFILSLQ
jgi:hypothetical protein